MLALGGHVSADQKETFMKAHLSLPRCLRVPPMGTGRGYEGNPPRQSRSRLYLSRMGAALKIKEGRRPLLRVVFRVGAQMNFIIGLDLTRGPET